VIFGHPALRELARLKRRAWLRSMRRRMSRPSGVVFGLLGLLVMGGWIASIFFRGSLAEGEIPDYLRESIARAGFFLLLGITIVGSLGHRGLYLPKDEIERLLAAPLKRSDLVRYRLMSNLSRTMLFALVASTVVATRSIAPFFGFVGTFLGVVTLPILGQGAALLAGDAENRFGNFAKRLPATFLRIVTGVGLWTLIMGLLFGGDIFGTLGLTGGRMTIADFLQNPVFEVLTLPLVPWAQTTTATSWLVFLPWTGVCLILWYVIFELTARVPVDFRELTLETSADVARRMRRFRSGRNLISGAKASKRTLGWQIPWLFGRGPFGAIAWLKLCAIVRKSRGALIFSVLVVAFLTVMTSTGALGWLSEPLMGAVVLASAATFYLCSGLRFDFRSDLDLMEMVKAWPLRPWRIFLATILPEVVLVSGLITLAILLRSAILGSFPPELLFVIVCVPVACLLWTSLDNGVFLFAPVRFVPGQDGAMHHTGRAMALVFLRMLLLGLSLSAAGLTAFVCSWIAGLLGASEATVLVAAVVGGGLVVLLMVSLLIWFGAWALARFDVAREKVLTG
jgi:hypothetical protein